MLCCRPAWVLAGATLLLCSCGSFPLPKVYLLGDAGAPTPGVTDEGGFEGGLPDIGLMTVMVPDYLDTTDIIRRTAVNQVITSENGRWGERLSLGITDALAADLARRLPDVVIENQSAQESPRRLKVEVERFEIADDGRCSITARWQVSSVAGKPLSNKEQGSFILAASSGSDAAAALAMTELIDQLAGQVALTVQASLLTQ